MPEPLRDLDDLQGDLLYIAARLDESDATTTLSDWLRDLSRQAARKEKLTAAYLEENGILRNAVEAALLVHSGTPWTTEKSDKWRRLTQSTEVTTKVLCDVLRSALEQETT